MEQWIPACCWWIIKYAGCLPEEACFGPDIQWWLFGLPLGLYPYMIFIAAMLAPLVYAGLYTITKLFNREKRKPMDDVLKHDIKKVLVVFAVIMLLEMAFALWVQSGIVY